MEALLQLVLFFVICQLVGLIFFHIYHMEDGQKRRLTVDWEVAMMELHHYLIDKQVKVEPHAIALYDETNTKYADIIYLNRAIVYRKNDGLETVLANMKSITFQLQNSELVVEAVLERDERKRRTFFVQPYGG